MKKKLMIVLVLCLCLFGLWILHSSTKEEKTPETKTTETTTTEQDKSSSENTEDQLPENEGEEVSEGLTGDEGAGMEVEEDSGYIIVK